MSKQIRLKLEKLEKDSDSYGDFLMDLVDDSPEDSLLILDIYDSLFGSANWYLRKVAVYSLLFILKRKDDSYIKHGFNYLFNEDEDEEVRVWAISGLASILTWGELAQYQQKGIFKIIDNQLDELTVRDASLRGALKMFGITEREIFLRIFDESKIEFQPDFERGKLYFLEELNDMRYSSE